MSKIRTVFVCNSCTYESPKWLGQCPECSAWNSLEENSLVVQSRSQNTRARVTPPVLLSSVASAKNDCISSGIAEFDRVLGGGFVPGQVIILAGAPGVGKSTLLTQLIKSIETSQKLAEILYVCGEESPSQVKLRADRMQLSAGNTLILSETDVDNIIATIQAHKKLTLIIVDSIQTLTSSDLTGAAGSIGQLRACTHKLTNLAKSIGVPVILVGHITKEGAVAGPKILEHVVDTVLYLEGDSQHLFRMLNTTKNRFGPVSEVGIFEMSETGMHEVANPSQIFLEQRNTTASGSCVTVIIEGFRPLLFEIQALATRTSFGYPRRTTSGFNVNRLQVLLAILEKRCGLNLSGHDVYVSVAGGFKVKEYACDLAVCLAVASSLKNKPLPSSLAAFGECGLSGEVRRVAQQSKRLQEAKKLGFSEVFCSDNVKSVKTAIEFSLA